MAPIPTQENEEIPESTQTKLNLAELKENITQVIVTKRSGSNDRETNHQFEITHDDQE